MELWIRSQDKKKLLKSTSFGLDNDETSIFANNYDGDYVNAGKYKTKERALEVLDEIQRLIKPTIINTKYNCEIKDGHNKNEFDLVMQPDESKLEIIQPTTIVYEMPKE